MDGWMDETLVVLQMLLNLTTKDILYTRVHGLSGTFTNGDDDRPCFWVTRPFLTPGIEEFFNSHVCQQLLEDDLRLYHAVNASLDRTIEALGRKEVARNLQKLSGGWVEFVGCAMMQVNELDVMKTSCYIWSEGCDHKCINQLGRHLKKKL